MATPEPARTYNQDHAPRKHTPGKRRVSIYWTWSYPWETNRDLTEMDNRFSSMTEVRRVAWPAFEATEWDKMHFLQGIGGTLELFHRSTLSFQRIVGEATGHPVAVFQRIDQAGYKLPIDERVLADTDTLMVFGLDHLVAEQEAEPGEIDAIREWLKRRNLPAARPAPRRGLPTTRQRQMEYRHHGDELVPASSDSPVHAPLMKALDVRSSITGASSRGERDEGDRAADHLPRPRQVGVVEQRQHIQLPPALAALRSNYPRH